MTLENSPVRITGYLYEEQDNSLETSAGRGRGQVESGELCSQSNDAL